MGPFDWVLLLCNCPVFHLAGAVNPIGKLSNCRELHSESDQSNKPNVNCSYNPFGSDGDRAKYVEVKIAHFQGCHGYHGNSCHGYKEMSS